MNEVIWSLTTSGGCAEPGEYTFMLKAGGQSYTQKARLVSRAVEEPRSGEASSKLAARSLSHCPAKPCYSRAWDTG